MKVKEVKECLASNEVILDEISKQVGIMVDMDKSRVKKLLGNSKSKSIALNSLAEPKDDFLKELNDLVEIYEDVVYLSQYYNNKEVK